jgi:surfeit locus 1 family protein
VGAGGSGGEIFENEQSGMVANEKVLLVQRGWVPRNFLNRNQLPEVQTPEGLVSFRGRIALPPSKLYELGGATTGPIRQNLDMQAYRQESGLPIRTDFSVLQLGEASEGLLREWPLIQLGIDKHYGYALQWFAIAALVSGLLVWFLVRPLLISSKKDSSHV